MMRMANKGRVERNASCCNLVGFLVGLHPGSFGDLKVCLYNNITPATDLVASFIFRQVYVYLSLSLGWVAAGFEWDGFLPSWVFLYLSST